jgi:hypothetical protein
VGGRPGSEESLAGLLPPRHGLIIVHVGTPHASTGMPVSNLRTRHARCRFVFFSQGRRVASRSRFRLAADLVEVVAPRYRAVATSRLGDLPNRRHQSSTPPQQKACFEKACRTLCGRAYLFQLLDAAATRAACGACISCRTNAVEKLVVCTAIPA